MLLRQRAFSQAELQIFFNPEKINEHKDFDKLKNYKLRVVQNGRRGKGAEEISCAELAKRIPKFYVYYMAKVQEFYFDVLKFPKEKFRFYELDEKEKAFYNKYHFDMEADIAGLGWTEIGGVHYRTDHDLKGHQEVSKQNLSVFDEESKSRFIPHVLELSFGVDRNFQTILMNAYESDKKRGNVVLHLRASLAPIKAAVFPIVKNDVKTTKIAGKIYDDIKGMWKISYDDSGSVGRRYSRNDEMGTPVCITIDEQSVKDNSVTLRDRDSTRQVRVKASELKNVLGKIIEGENLLKLGREVKTRIK